MRIEPELSSVAIILAGDFNPAIFTPAWFAMHNLLGKGVVDSAQLAVAHPQVTEFTADWLQIHVDVGRFSAETLQAPYVRLCDLVVRAFKENLHHTPLRAVGINRQVHFRVESYAKRDQIGRSLAPVEPWGDWGKALGKDGRQGGMTSLTMTQINLDGRSSDDKVNVTVEPSNRVGVGRDGVYTHVNDHYAIDNTDSTQGLMDLLERSFERSLNRSDGIIDHIMSLANR